MEFCKFYTRVITTRRDYKKFADCLKLTLMTDETLCVLVMRGMLHAVLELMGENPFPDDPPKFIRASLYKYHFTSTDKNDETRSEQRRNVKFLVDFMCTVVV